MTWAEEALVEMATVGIMEAHLVRIMLILDQKIGADFTEIVLRKEITTGMTRKVAINKMKTN